MKRPTQEDIDSFLKGAQYQIDRTKRLEEEGFHKKNDVPLQSVYTSLASDHASLARAKFLNGEPIASVRQEFATAARYIIKSFTMAYDPDDPEYVGDNIPKDTFSYGYKQFSGVDVMETRAIEGFNWALMAANIELGRELAGWYQDSKDGHKMDPDVNRYTYAWKYALLEDPEKGAALLQQTIDEYTAKPTKNGTRLN